MSEVVTSDFFKLAEAHDEKQIMDIAEFREVLCYKDSRTGKHELSYKGIKHLVLEMAAKGFPLEVVESKILAPLSSYEGISLTYRANE